MKAKRLFLFLAEEKELPWVAGLDVARVELGKGKRVIVRGGRLDGKYQITVPPRSEDLTKLAARA